MNRLEFEGIALLGLALAFLAMATAIHYYRSEYLVVSAQFEAFKQTTEALGRLAKAEADAKLAKSNLEADHAKNVLVAALSDNDRLRRAAEATRASRGYLPGVPAGAAGTGPACFDRAKLDAALRGFGTGVAGLVGEGADAATVRDAWRGWYEGQVRAFGDSAPAQSNARGGVK